VGPHGACLSLCNVTAPGGTPRRGASPGFRPTRVTPLFSPVTLAVTLPGCQPARADTSVLPAGTLASETRPSEMKGSWNPVLSPIPVSPRLTLMVAPKAGGARPSVSMEGMETPRGKEFAPLSFLTPHHPVVTSCLGPAAIAHDSDGHSPAFAVLARGRRMWSAWHSVGNRVSTQGRGRGPGWTATGQG
jgi:hypothetical protein